MNILSLYVCHCEIYSEMVIFFLWYIRTEDHTRRDDFSLSAYYVCVDILNVAIFLKKRYVIFR